MRLIDADKLKAIIIEGYREEFFGSVLWDILNDIPTAYDIDKVVEELNDLVIPIDKKQTRIPLDKAIEIVKQGVR